MNSDYKFRDEEELQDLVIANLSVIPIDGEFLTLFPAGKEFVTNTGPSDIFAVAEKTKTYYIIDTKYEKGRDKAVAQVLRYMGALRLALGSDAKIKGAIIAPGFEQHTIFAQKALPDGMLLLIDSRKEILPYCPETVLLEGNRCLVHKAKTGYIYAPFFRSSFSSDYKSDKNSQTLVEISTDPQLAASFRRVGVDGSEEDIHTLKFKIRGEFERKALGLLFLNLFYLCSDPWKNGNIMPADDITLEPCYSDTVDFSERLEDAKRMIGMWQSLVAPSKIQEIPLTQSTVETKEPIKQQFAETDEIF
jgi:hypothetical protein